MMNTKLLLAIGALALAPSAYADQSVNYQQMRHDAVGAATLAVTPNGKMMRASGLRADGQDGFRVRLPEATTSWEAEFVVPLDVGDTLRFNPIADGEAIAPLNVTRVENGYSAFVEFTSSADTSYVMELRDAGAITAVWECFPGGECEPEDPPGGGGGGGGGGGVPGPGGIIIEIERDLDVEPPSLFAESFSQGLEGLRRGPNADCQHIMSFDNPGIISVGGTILGTADEVVITERSEQAFGRYAYAGFGAIRVQSSASQIVLTDETAQ